MLAVFHAYHGHDSKNGTMRLDSVAVIDPPREGKVTTATYLVPETQFPLELMQSHRYLTVGNVHAGLPKCNTKHHRSVHSSALYCLY